MPLYYQLEFYLNSGLKVSLITGCGRHSYRNRFNNSQDESSESSTDETEETNRDCQPHYHGSIPRLIIKLDRENNQLREDMSPETPGCPQELKAGPAPIYQIPIFTFTFDGADEQTSDNTSRDTYVPEIPPSVPAPPANYEQSSESGEAICLPPEMKPIDTKLTLDLFNSRGRHDECRRRCTGVDECVSACECCRTPQPEAQLIPFIDEPNSEPIIFENDCIRNKVSTPKIRRILPSLSLDLSDAKKPTTVDAVCQTQNSPLEPEAKLLKIDFSRSNEMRQSFKRETKNIQNIHSRLRKTLFSVTKSLSSKSDDTEVSLSTSESFDDESKYLSDDKNFPPLETDVNPILNAVDKKSWKSPDEYRPAFGKVKALAKHFNQINLKYCAKNYKRSWQSSPNLSTGGVQKKSFKVKDNLPVSTSLADIQYECDKSDTDEIKTDRMSEDEVKSILIQLEDWSKFGSRGSEDTLAQGNEFELPNLPSEDPTENNVSTAESLIFNEIIDKKPRKITLENVILKSSQAGCDTKRSQGIDTVVSRGLHKSDEWVSTGRRVGGRAAGGSCPDVRRAFPSCKPTHTPSMK